MSRKRTTKTKFDWLTQLVEAPARIPANDEFPFAGYFEEKHVHVYWKDGSWYWSDAQMGSNGLCHEDIAHGPYPTDEGAYLDAIGY